MFFVDELKRTISEPLSEGFNSLKKLPHIRQRPIRSPKDPKMAGSLPFYVRRPWPTGGQEALGAANLPLAPEQRSSGAKAYA
jgi:hypothetical protein